MRPYLEWHSDPDRLNRYINRKDDEAIGGTIPNRNNRDLFKRMREAGAGQRETEQYLHLTLSLPSGVAATKKVWKRIVTTALKMLGLDPEMTPWFAKRHTDGGCDHVHTAAALCDFAGRPLKVLGSVEKSEAIHKHLCKMLGLPTPTYFDAKAVPRLDPVTPERRLKDEAQQALHNDLQNAFHHCQPEDLTLLNDYLADLPDAFQGSVKLNSYQKPAFRFANTANSFFSGVLGTAWEPAAMRARFAFCSTLRQLRNALDCDALIDIFRTPKMETLLDHAIRSTQAARTAGAIENPLEPTPRDPRKGYGVVSADRPFDAPRRSKGSTGRAAGPVVDRIDADVEQFSDPASSDDQSIAAVDDGGRNFDENYFGPSGQDGEENRQHDEDVKPTSGLTFAELLTRISIAAGSCAAGWRLSATHDHRGAAVVFADGSAVKVGAKGVKIAVEGAEASLFAAAYAAQFGEQNLVDAEAEMENEPEQDDTLGF